MTQYKTSVLWDSTLVSLELTEDNAITREAGIAGLVQRCLKITTGAPSTLAGYFMPSAMVQNVVSAVVYINEGTIAAPVWKTVTHS